MVPQGFPVCFEGGVRRGKRCQGPRRGCSIREHLSISSAFLWVWVGQSAYFWPFTKTQSLSTNFGQKPAQFGGTPKSCWHYPNLAKAQEVRIVRVGFGRTLEDSLPAHGGIGKASPYPHHSVPSTCLLSSLSLRNYYNNQTI